MTKRPPHTRLEAFLCKGLRFGSLGALAKSFGLSDHQSFPGVSCVYRPGYKQKMSQEGTFSFEDISEVERKEIRSPGEFRAALTYSLARLQSPPLSLSRDAASQVLETLLDNELPNWESEGFSTRATVSRQSLEARDNPEAESVVDFDGFFKRLPEQEQKRDP